MMKTWKRRACVVGGFVCCAGVACSQVVDQQVIYTIQWDQPVLESGVATGAVFLTADPPIGYEIWCYLPCGGGGFPPNATAVSKAIASSILDFINIQNGATGVLSWTVPSEFNVASKPGTPDGTGGIKQSQAGQFGIPVNSSPNTSSTVKLLELEWDPLGDYSERVVEFQTKSTSAKVFVDVGLVAWVGDNAKRIDDTGGFLVRPPCYADCDKNGPLDIDDFICFQSYYALGDPIADCEGDGVLTIDDFICFQTVFAIGC